MPKDPAASNRQLMLAFGFVGEMLFAIAIPTALIAYAAYRLDRAYGFFPYGTIAGLVLALAIDAVLLNRLAVKARDLFRAPNDPSV